MVVGRTSVDTLLMYTYSSDQTQLILLILPYLVDSEVATLVAQLE